jgi:carboxylesterase
LLLLVLGHVHDDFVLVLLLVHVLGFHLLLTASRAPCYHPPVALDGGQSLFLPGGPRGALLVHGFTGTPHEMGYLGAHLHRAGMTVVAPLLAGHGSTTAALDETGWTDWLASAEAGLAELRRCCSAMHVAGFSMGGALALLLAVRHTDVSALALMSTPLWLPFYFRWPLRLLARTGLDRRLRVAPRLTRGDVRDRDQRRANVVTPAYPLRATRSMLDLVDEARAHLEEVRCPALVLHARRDHTVPYACSTELARRLRHARLVTLRRSFHVIPIDVEREQVAREVEAFFRAHPEESPHVP